jgi:hypothetical protein
LFNEIVIEFETDRIGEVGGLRIFIIKCDIGKSPNISISCFLQFLPARKSRSITGLIDLDPGCIPCAALLGSRTANEGVFGIALFVKEDLSCDCSQSGKTGVK